MTSDDKKTTSRAEKALELALDIRKFEIELYWKRATYFWAFLAVALAGYLTVLAAKDICPKEKSDALVGVSCLGVVFSLAWYFVNRGSKFWQENWEKHVDMLEDDINGPLYKTIMKKENLSWLKPWDPFPFSVSKINQILSLFLALLFLLLAASTLIRYYRTTPPLDGLAISILFLTVATVFVLCWKGGTDLRDTPQTSAQYRVGFGQSLSEHEGEPKEQALGNDEIVKVSVGRRTVKIVDPPTKKPEQKA